VEPRLSFLDRDVPDGWRHYSLTAVDGAGNESEAIGPYAVQVRRVPHLREGQ
jgi:hypothetical protein